MMTVVKRGAAVLTLVLLLGGCSADGREVPASTAPTGSDVQKFSPCVCTDTGYGPPTFGWRG